MPQPVIRAALRAARDTAARVIVIFFFIIVLLLNLNEVMLVPAS